jgi:hypothetical protein
MPTLHRISAAHLAECNIGAGEDDAQSGIDRRWRAPIQLGQIGREEWELAAQVKAARADV